MAQGAFLEQKRGMSPTSLAVVIALHAAGIGALLLAKGPQFITPPKTTTTIFNVPVDDPPPEQLPQEPLEPNPAPPLQISKIETVPPIIDLPAPGPRIEPGPRIREIVIPGPVGEVDLPRVTKIEPPRPAPLPEPVRIEAEIDPRFLAQLQPPYPASEERAEREGSVRIEVTIGPDGRVKAVRRVSATSDAFWRATERQALGRWRFKAATVDGRAVESRKTMTVHFQLQG